MSEFIFLEQCNGEICPNSKRDSQWEIYFTIIISFSSDTTIQNELRFISENFPPFKKIKNSPSLRTFLSFQAHGNLNTSEFTCFMCLLPK